MFLQIVPLVTWAQSAAKVEEKKAAVESGLPRMSETQRARFDWNTRTLLDSYEKVGRKNEKWNTSARKALEKFALIRSAPKNSNGAAIDLVETNCAIAAAAGCDDPMIGYLHARFVLANRDIKPSELAVSLSRSSEALANSGYPEIRKFYAALRTAEQLNLDATTNTPPAVHRFRRQAIDNLALALEDKTMPVGEMDEACQDIFQVLKMNKVQYDACYKAIEKPLFQNWPEESVVWLIKGNAYIESAWRARGGGYADTVKDEGWELFRQHLATAEESFNKAWKLNPKDPRIAVRMITVELGQGQGRMRMELWFQRAMELDPKNYDACTAKLYYLEPKWHGSITEMLEFGKECVQSKTWGGRVPLILLDAHLSTVRYARDKSGNDAYWKHPEVWPDIAAAFERFFELNPEAVSWYHNYAWYAYRAEKWAKFNELLPKLGEINYDYFGGRREFEKMVQIAKERSASPQTKENSK